MKKNSLVRTILNTVLGYRGAPVKFEFLYDIIAKRRHLKDTLERWKYNRAVKYLQESDKIKVIRQGADKFVKLTQKGKVQTLLRKVENSKLSPKEKWDGKWRMVIWDIPETSSNQRNQIRYVLKKLGFHRVQQSVYIRPHPLNSDAVLYLQESGLIDYIRFIRVDKMDEEKTLLKKFDISPPNPH